MPLSLRDVVAGIERLAPTSLAEEWDNVGLLVDRLDDGPIRRCLLTIDLTGSVLDEAIAGAHELIVAYHPPIFTPLSRLLASDPRQRVVLRAIAHGIAIHAPHTALDAARGGLNDWLADGIGGAAGDARRALSPPPRAGGTAAPEPSSTADPTVGVGRRLEFAEPTPLADLVARIKAHLELEHVRVATAARHLDGAPIRTVAICAGAGGSVLGPVDADLLWTGEMRHHDILAALDRGASVVLCDHTNTERGYLPVLRQRLGAELRGEISIQVSSSDEEPLRVV